jgi:hypothetical protein
MPSNRHFFLGIGVMVSLSGVLVATYLQMRGPATTPPLAPYQPLQGETPLLVQLEPPAEEVKLEEDGIGDEVRGESGWVASGNPDSIPLLIRYLKSQEELVQLAALKELAAMGSEAKGAVPALVGALQDPKASIRVEAAVTLIHLNVQARAAVRALTTELKSANAGSRARAATAVKQLVNPPPEEFSCWGPGPPPRIARPWVSRAVEQAIK